MTVHIEIDTRPILDLAVLTEAMDAHARVRPTTREEHARWWYRSGELWASYGVIEGRCNGSTVHAFEKARAQYVLAGDPEMARVCGELVEAHSRGVLR